MRHRVGRHQQLKSEEARQQVLMHIGRPQARLVLLLEPLPDVLDHLEQERACAGGWVEDEHAVRFLLDGLARFLAFHGNLRLVGQPVLEPKLLTQQPVNALHDIRHHRLGRVIHPRSSRSLGS